MWDLSTALEFFHKNLSTCGEGGPTPQVRTLLNLQILLTNIPLSGVDPPAGAVRADLLEVLHPLPLAVALPHRQPDAAQGEEPRIYKPQLRQQ